MEIINDFARAYPALCIIYALLMRDLYFIVYLVTSNFLNGFFKYQIAKPIMGDKEYPILGKGTRPPGASHCGIWKDPPNYKTKSYGMPSGHAQEATGFATYIILDNLSKGGNILNITNIIVIFFALFIPYSRVYNWQSEITIPNFELSYYTTSNNRRYNWNNYGNDWLALKTNNIKFNKIN